MKILYTHGKVRGSLIGRESIINKWNEMCRKMTKKKTEANLEVLSATKDGGRQNVVNRELLRDNKFESQSAKSLLLWILELLYISLENSKMNWIGIMVKIVGYIRFYDKDSQLYKVLILCQISI